MKIVIPTYRRADKQLTLDLLHPDLHERVVLVVRPEEASSYRKHNVPLDVLPEAVKTLGGTRQYIWDKYSYEDFVMMDDDITEFRTMEPGSWKTQEMSKGHQD